MEREFPTSSFTRAARRHTGCLSLLCVVGVALLLTLGIMLGIEVVQNAPDGPPAPPAPPPSPVPTYLAACSAHEGCASLQGDCCPTAKGVLLQCCSSIASNASITPFHGMCYAPTPAKNVTHFFTDDYMAAWAEPLWKGRDDLGAIRALNVGALRLYGNDPRLDHEEFLNRAYELGLGVIVAISDYPYTQDPKGKCATQPPYDCFSEVRAQYSSMLKKGFAVKSGVSRRFHAAIKAVILINEPELKITYQGQIAKEAWSEGYYAKALLSAVDGALSAEKDLRITGPKPPFTIVHSFATCELCKSNAAGNRAGKGQTVGTYPALGFMYDFVVGALSPGLYGYTPRNDLRSALQQRVMLGFNTQDTTDVICSHLLSPLQQTPLAGLPVWAGEYKAWYQSLSDSKMSDFEEDFKKISSWVGASSCAGAGARLEGVSLFEFQVSYFKGSEDHQMDFGVYELGSKKIGSTVKDEATNWETYPVWCRRARRNAEGQSWVDAIARVLGGKAKDSSCPAELDEPELVARLQRTMFNAQRSVSDRLGLDREVGRLNWRALEAREFAVMPIGNPYCWIAGFSYELCCTGPGGNPACWDGHFTFELCCHENEGAETKARSAAVARYVLESSEELERVGLFRDYVPHKDCWEPPNYTFEFCCDLKQGLRGRSVCWDGWRLTFERCCFRGLKGEEGEGLEGGDDLPEAPDLQAEELMPLGAECWKEGYSYRACCRVEGAEEPQSCWDALHTELRCCQGLAAPAQRWRPVPKSSKAAQCLDAVHGRPLDLGVKSCGSGRYFHLATLGKLRLRKDFWATAVPWFLAPRFNTSAWARHVASFGPTGVHEHQVVGGLCLPSFCEPETVGAYVAPRVNPWWRFPRARALPLNASHVLLPPPLARPQQLIRSHGFLPMWVSKSSCLALVNNSFCDEFWQFAVSERRRFAWDVPVALALVLLVVRLKIPASWAQRPSGSRPDALRVLLTAAAVWTHTFSHGSWLPAERKQLGAWFFSKDLTYKVNIGFVVLSTHLRLREPSRCVGLAIGRRWLQLGPALGFWTLIYLYVFVDCIPMNNAVKSSGLHRWYSERRSECQVPEHLVWSLLLLHEPITGRNSPCHNSDIFETQFWLDAVVVLLRAGPSSWLAMPLWHVALYWRFLAIAEEGHEWAFAYSHGFRMLLPPAFLTMALWPVVFTRMRDLGAVLGVLVDLLGFVLVALSCVQDLLAFGPTGSVPLRPWRQAAAFQVSELLFVLGLLLLLRRDGSTWPWTSRLSQLSLGINLSNLFVFHFLGGFLLEEPPGLLARAERAKVI
ncbi:unnamed protein product [Effrenium voratum]|uniref:Uncharacterized protein n=1 Tax=Effrenium voratum TaxID=2562239 RepID=A0AA36ILI5_9DINO|nr:unnamed protein product [Effrenium voratum]